VSILLRNNGIGDTHTFDVAYTLNGIVQPTIPNNTLFAKPDQTGEVELYIPGLKNGANVLEITIVNVDGDGDDELQGNNSQSISFEIDPGNQVLTLVFSPDSKPEEATWDILDNQGAVIYTGGPYDGPFSFNIVDICLRRDSCYTLRLHDSGGDGMSNGYVSLTIGGFTLFEFSGENFGSELAVPFCAKALCANLALSANVTPASGSGISDGQIEAQVLGGTPPYFFILNNIDGQDSPLFGNLLPGSYSLLCLDALGCSVEIQVNIGAVGTETPENVRVLQASPNPTSGIVHLQIAAFGAEKTATCEVYDAHGKKIQTSRMTRWDNTLHGNIALDKFPAGVYHLRVLGLDRMYATRVIRK
jgi:hypothetical protein